jgi:hypothetical protein
MSHTKGKLIARGDLVCDSSGNSLWDYHDKSKEENEANARRLVACWNALEGVPTTWIKKYTGRPLKNIVEQSCDLVMKEEALTEELIATQEERDALKSERGELVSIIRNLSNLDGKCAYDRFEISQIIEQVLSKYPEPQPTKEPKCL